MANLVDYMADEASSIRVSIAMMRHQDEKSKLGRKSFFFF